MQASRNPRSPRSRHRHSRSASKQRSVLNCIVDDSALLADIRDDSQPGIASWVADGLVNVYVPLYTLERLNELRSGPPPTDTDAQNALEWLDSITTRTENNVTGRVQLQGPEDCYETWPQVLNWLLPDTPLASRSDTPDLLYDLSDSVADTLTLNASSNAQTGRTSLGPIGPPPRSPQSNGISKSAGAAVTPTGYETFQASESVRALLNYAVWRTHHEGWGPTTAGRYLLLSNDPVTQQQGRKFGVRAKSLDQLRGVLARDAPKSQQSRHQRGGSGSAPYAKQTVPKDSQFAEDETDEIVFRPSQRPSSSRSSGTPNVWDPDHFGRESGASGFIIDPKDGPTEAKPADTLASAAVSSRGRSRGKARGSSGSTILPSQPRGAHSRGVPESRAGTTRLITRRLDPESYTRQTNDPQRGRDRRRLWEPS